MESGLLKKSSLYLNLSLIMAVGGNLFIAGLFARALFEPLQHADFIFQTGLWVFLMELFSIFLGAITFHFVLARKDLFWAIHTLIIFAGISTMILGFGYFVLHNIYIPGIFVVSFIAKGFGKKPSLVGAWLIISVLTVLIIGPQFWLNLFPFPEELMQYAPLDAQERHIRGEIAGEFVDRPQTLLVWGALYFSVIAAMELFFALRRSASTAVVKGLDGS